MIRHWDDVEPIRRERGQIAGTWRRPPGVGALGRIELLEDGDGEA